MKIKTAELIGAALDWAVAKCEGREFYQHEGDGATCMRGGWTDYSTDWVQGGSIIESERIFVRPKTAGDWRCWIYDGRGEGIKFDQHGPTPLIAAMRCYVASKLGDEVDVPEELV